MAARSLAMAMVLLALPFWRPAAAASANVLVDNKSGHNILGLILSHKYSDGSELAEVNTAPPIANGRNSGNLKNPANYKLGTIQTDWWRLEFGTDSGWQCNSDPDNWREGFDKIETLIVTQDMSSIWLGAPTATDNVKDIMAALTAFNIGSKLVSFFQWGGNPLSATTFAGIVAGQIVNNLVAFGVLNVGVTAGYKAHMLMSSDDGGTVKFTIQGLDLDATAAEDSSKKFSSTLTISSPSGTSKTNINCYCRLPTCELRPNIMRPLSVLNLCVDAPTWDNGALVYLQYCHWRENQRFELQPNGALKFPGTNKCLDSWSSTRSAGTTVQVWDCNGEPQQMWQRDENNALRPAFAPHLCLDVPEQRFVAGQRLQLWYCNNSPAQQLSLSFLPAVSSQSISVSYLCADAPSWNNGAQLYLYPCHGGGNQRLIRWSDESLRFAGNTNKCLDVRTSGTADGTPVQVFDCNGSNAQKWRRDEYNALRPVSSTWKCLDVPGGRFVQGALLQIWNCNRSPAQTFRLDMLPVLSGVSFAASADAKKHRRVPRKDAIVSAAVVAPRSSIVWPPSPPPGVPEVPADALPQNSPVVPTAAAEEAHPVVTAAADAPPSPSVLP